MIQEGMLHLVDPREVPVAFYGSNLLVGIGPLFVPSRSDVYGSGVYVNNLIVVVLGGFNGLFCVVATLHVADYVIIDAACCWKVVRLILAQINTYRLVLLLWEHPFVIVSGFNPNINK